MRLLIMMIMEAVIVEVIIVKVKTIISVVL